MHVNTKWDCNRLYRLPLAKGEIVRDSVNDLLESGFNGEWMGTLDIM